MHHIHHTEGIILGSKNLGETGKYYTIFTRDLGMIRASAQGVRKMSSKLRFILRDFAHVKLDIVEGREYMRITSASKTEHLENICKNPDTFRIFYNVSSLLNRLLAGVEKNEKLFEDVLKGLNILEKKEKKEDLENTEAVLVLRILNHLGYIGGGGEVDEFLRSPLEEEILYEVSKWRSSIFRQINKAIKETHL